MASIYRSKPLEEVTPEYWAADLDVNLRSAFLCAHAAIPHMRKAGGGRIVNFADWLARSGRPHYKGFTSYYVAKAGVIALTEALALEVAGDHILVNAIAPGPIVPPPDMTDDEIADVAKATPLGRWGGEIEIARAVLFLLRDRVRHRRDDPRRRRPAPRIALEGSSTMNGRLNGTRVLVTGSSKGIGRGMADPHGAGRRRRRHQLPQGSGRRRRSASPRSARWDGASVALKGDVGSVADVRTLVARKRRGARRTRRAREQRRHRAARARSGTSPRPTSTRC